MRIRGAAQQIEGLLAAVGDQNIVGIAGDALCGGAGEEVAAQGFVAAGRAELHQGAEVRAVENFAAAGAEFFDRKHGFGGARTGKVDDAGGRVRPRESSGEAVSARDQFSLSGRGSGEPQT